MTERIGTTNVSGIENIRNFPLDRIHKIISSMNPESIKLNIIDRFNPRLKSTKLLSPLELFKNETPAPENKNNSFPVLKPISLFSSVTTLQNNNSVIQDGVSQKTIDAVKKVSGNCWIGKLASNGNREAAVIMPQNIDKTKPFEVIYYFHGHNGKIANSLGDPTYGFGQKIQDIAKNKNVIVVLPQGPKKELNYTWMNGKFKEDMAQFQKDTLEIIKNNFGSDIQIQSTTVKGHSGGGLPIYNAATQGKLTADRVDFLDASYGSWASQAYKSMAAKNPYVQFNLTYIPGTQTQTDALSLKKKPGVTLYQSNVGHSSVPRKYF